MLMEDFSMPPLFNIERLLTPQLLICLLLLKLKEMQFCKCQHHSLINNNIICPPKTVLFIQQVRKPFLPIAASCQLPRKPTVFGHGAFQAKNLIPAPRYTGTLTKPCIHLSHKIACLGKMDTCNWFRNFNSLIFSSLPNSVLKL